MISGTNIVGAQDGKPVQLRGFVFTAGAWFDTPPGSPNGDLANLGFMQSEADFAQIADWGANLAVLYFCTVSRRSYGKSDLQSDLSTTVLSPSQAFNAPILIGEFSPSLAGTGSTGRRT